MGACNAMGGHLAVPINEQEHANIQSFLAEALGDPNTLDYTLSTNAVWTGLTAIRVNAKTGEPNYAMLALLGVPFYNRMHQEKTIELPTEDGKNFVYKWYGIHCKGCSPI